ncbi:MOP flippase family protein [Sulfurovum sp. CS9]|uniref:MOP flippase family protein n=1 Tax=Sulfurovum sp. CS9 TaxID=3391146 RepID=UPI0039EA0438
MKDLKKQAIGGMKWTSLSTGVRTILQLIQLIVLARFLSAEDFGLVAIVMVVIGFSQLFMDMGISNAIIHKQSITDVQLSSLYWLNIFSGMVLTLIVFMIAPAVATFYNEEAIIPLLQLLSFSFLINSIGNQYRVLLRKELKFNVLAKVEVFAGVWAFVSAVTLAIQGFGAYSLVYATLVNVIISNTILLSIGLKSHRPKFIYHHQEIKSFLTFGLYQMGQNSIIYFNNQFDVILIGKLLGTEALGIYSLTKQLVMRPAQVISPIITNVTFPIMAKIQDDLPRLKSVYLKIINMLSSINFPIYTLMAMLASSLVPLILGEKWINAIEIFQILSIFALVRSTANPAGSLMLARGRADLGFWWSVAGFIFIPMVIYTGSYWGLIGVSFSLLFYQVVLLLPNWYFIVQKMCNASFIEYFRVLGIPLVVTLLSVAMTYIIMINIEVEALLDIVLWFLLSFIFYILLSYRINKQFIIEIRSLLIK